MILGIFDDITLQQLLNNLIKLPNLSKLFLKCNEKYNINYNLINNNCKHLTKLTELKIQDHTYNLIEKSIIINNRKYC